MKSTNTSLLNEGLVLWKRSTHTFISYNMTVFDIEICKHVKLLNACKSRVNSKE